MQQALSSLILTPHDYSEFPLISTDCNPKQACRRLQPSIGLAPAGNKKHNNGRVGDKNKAAVMLLSKAKQAATRGLVVFRRVGAANSYDEVVLNFAYCNPIM